MCITYKYDVSFRSNSESERVCVVTEEINRPNPSNLVKDKKHSSVPYDIGCHTQHNHNEHKLYLSHAVAT